MVTKSQVFVWCNKFSIAESNNLEYKNLIIKIVLNELSDPGVAGRLLNNSNVLNISTG